MTRRPWLLICAPIVVVAALGCASRAHLGKAQPPEGPATTIDPPAGTIRGTLADGLRVFLGIPFAAPPVGAYRFRPPQPAAHFDTAFDATHYGAVCPQLGRGADEGKAVADDVAVEGSEDCLHLNVWAHTDETPRPVMVFIHGGGFQQGSNSKLYYEGANLARASGAVVVTVNYRLGVLGLLATTALADESGDGSAGNYAIRDQLAALRWVHDNIAAFGGDAANVTVFGESAGAMSVCALVASPLSTGLFARGIIESAGGCLSLPRLDAGVGRAQSGFARGAEIAAAAGCAGDDQLACLRSRDAASLVRAGTRELTPHPMLALRYSPVIDGVVLTASTAERLRSGAVRVPLVIGTNADESSIFVARSPLDDDADYERKLTDAFGAQADAVSKIYPPSAFGSAREAYARAITETGFVCPSLALADAAATGGTPVYAYHFTYARAGRIGDKLGAFHGAEVAYLFWSFPAVLKPNADDQRITATLRTAWAGFATSGVPVADPPWPPYRSAAPAIYLIDVPSSVVTDVTDGRCAALHVAGVVDAAQ